MQNELAMMALLVLVAVTLAVMTSLARKQRRQRSDALQARFGPEYDRLLAAYGDRARAERELLARQRRLQKLDIRPLSDEEADRFGSEWAIVQQRFVDDPHSAVSEADRLVKEVIAARGYPLGNFDQRVADLSVEHANVVEHYRAARALAQASEDGTAGTEELRKALVHYRALFSDMLRTPQPVYPALGEAHAH